MYIYYLYAQLADKQTKKQVNKYVNIIDAFNRFVLRSQYAREQITNQTSKKQTNKQKNKIL